MASFGQGFASAFAPIYLAGLDAEARKKADERAERALRMQEQEFQQRQQDVQAAKDAAAQSYGRVGKAALTGDLQTDTGIGAQQAEALDTKSGDASFDAYDRAQLADTLRANATRTPEQIAAYAADREAAIPTTRKMLVKGEGEGEQTTEQAFPYSKYGAQATPEEMAALKPAAPTMTKDMARDEYVKRLYAAGMPEKAQAAEIGGLQVSGLKRSERYAEKQETALGFRDAVMDEIKKNKGDLEPVFDKFFKDVYNEGKLPGTDDGKTAKVVQGALGGKTVLLTDKDGKQQTLPLDINTIQMLTEKTQGLMMASSSPDSYWKNKEQDLKEKTLAIQGRQVAVSEKELKEKMDVGLFRAQANQANAAGNASNEHANLYKNMIRLASENREAGQAMKPFIEEFAKLTPEEQAGTKGQGILLSAATSAARKTGDITGIISALKKPDKSGVDAQWNIIEQDLYKQGSKPADINAAKDSYYANKGFAPAALQAAVSNGIFPDGKKMTGADVDSFNARFPNSKIDKTELSWVKPITPTAATAAIPTEEKFIREKNSRGALIYTPSPRGQTKQKWAELDSTQQAIPK